MADKPPDIPTYGAGLMSDHNDNEDGDRKVYVVKQYILGEVLGEGSYAKVYEALDTITLRRVAIKVVRKSHVRKRFGRTAEYNVMQEIAIMKRLQGHSNIVNLVEVFENREKQKIYIVLEFVSGATLHQVMQNGKGRPMPARQLQAYLRQIIVGLEYIHRCGIIHRDIKPDNIMLDLTGRIKIFDFGVSQMLSMFDRADLCTSPLGTPAFQPPEVALGSEAFEGFKSDIWSLGVTVFHLATGEYPFSGTNVYTLLDNIGRGEFAIPDVVDPLLRDLILGMMDTNVSSRFTLKAVKMHPWVTLNKFDDILPTAADQAELEIPSPRRSCSVLPVVALLEQNLEAERLLAAQGAERQASLESRRAAMEEAQRQQAQPQSPIDILRSSASNKSLVLTDTSSDRSDDEAISSGDSYGGKSSDLWARRRRASATDGDDERSSDSELQRPAVGRKPVCTVS